VVDAFQKKSKSGIATPTFHYSPPPDGSRETAASGKDYPGENRRRYDHPEAAPARRQTAGRSVADGDGKVAKITQYNLAYINRLVCRTDNGCVLGYDNSHDGRHRQFMGRVEPVAFTDYQSLAKRFRDEVREL
jgi:hypothetical protein